MRDSHLSRCYYHQKLPQSRRKVRCEDEHRSHTAGTAPRTKASRHCHRSRVVPIGRVLRDCRFYWCRFFNSNSLLSTYFDRLVEIPEDVSLDDVESSRFRLLQHGVPGSNRAGESHPSVYWSTSRHETREEERRGEWQPTNLLG